LTRCAYRSIFHSLTRFCRRGFASVSQLHRSYVTSTVSHHDDQLRNISPVALLSAMALVGRYKMLRRNMPRLFVRLIILTTLVSALFFTPVEPTHNTVRAGSSCPICDDAYAECVANCPGLGEPGHLTCMRNCRDEQSECTFFVCDRCYPKDGCN